MLQSLIHHITTAPDWLVYLLVGSIVFAEDALFVGFVLPGETAALLGGVAANLGHVPLAGVLAVVIVAAITGDSVGYEVGRTLGTRLLASKVLSRHASGIEKARALLSRRGGAAVFLGRWTAFFRAVMPALAGTARMPYRRFIVFNAAGGITWGTAVVLAGYLAGASYTQVESWLGHGTAIAVAVIVIAGVVVWRIRRHRRHS